MKEILIPATALITIFGLPIIAMLVAIIATFIEKPRWMQTAKA